MIEQTEITRMVKQALAEDIGSGDATADLIPAQQQATATIISREPAILCGQDWVNTVFEQFNSQIDIQWACQDGESIDENQCLATLKGSARHLLTGERSALNFLQLLSATATQTKHYCNAIAHTTTKILDTRKNHSRT